MAMTSRAKVGNDGEVSKSPLREGDIIPKVRVVVSGLLYVDLSAWQFAPSYND
jgi:hypothetical protein